MWAGVALAMLTKGLIAPVFFLGAAIPYLLLTGQWRRWRELRPFSGFLLFLAIAAPWHILCGLANPDQGHPVGNHPTIGNVHGFFYFYFINEHVLRFFGMRYPHDYNKLPFASYWLLHLVWLFPWSLFLPALIAVAWKTRRALARSICATMPARRSISISTTPRAKKWPLRGGSSSACAPCGCSPVLCLDTVIFLHLHQPGVLHLPGVAAAVHADRRRDRRD